MNALLRPLESLVREATPYWRWFIRLRHWPRLAYLRWLERELHPADMRLTSIVRERLLLERAP